MAISRLPFWGLVINEESKVATSPLLSRGSPNQGGIKSGAIRWGRGGGVGQNGRCDVNTLNFSPTQGPRDGSHRVPTFDSP